MSLERCSAQKFSEFPSAASASRRRKEICVCCVYMQGEMSSVGKGDCSAVEQIITHFLGETILLPYLLVSVRRGLSTASLGPVARVSQGCGQGQGLRSHLEAEPGKNRLPSPCCLLTEFTSRGCLARGFSFCRPSPRPLHPSRLPAASDHGGFPAAVTSLWSLLPRHQQRRLSDPQEEPTPSLQTSLKEAVRTQGNLPLEQLKTN